MSNTDESDKTAIPEELQTRVLEALASSSRKARPQGASLNSFEQDSDIMDEDGTNKYDLLCPRAGCGCKILLKATAKRVLKDKVEPVGLVSYFIIIIF